MKTARAVQRFYVLPCCLLLLNLAVELVSYKAQVIDDAILRTAAIIAMVLVGGSVVRFVVAPALSFLVGTLHGSSRQRGELAEIVFLSLLGVVVFWLYYRVYILGPASVLPAAWQNPPGHR